MKSVRIDKTFLFITLALIGFGSLIFFSASLGLLARASADYSKIAFSQAILGLCLGTVILEAPQESGALITAELALEYGREVFAVPGSIFDPNFAGCHQVISLGQAKLVSRPEEVLEELGIVSPTNTDPQSLYQPQNDIESTILSLLTTMPQPLDNIVQKAEISAAQTNATLTMMELAGAVKDTGGGMWVRK